MTTTSDTTRSPRSALLERACFSAAASLPLNRSAENAVRTLILAQEAKAAAASQQPCAKPERLARALLRDTRLRSAAIDGTALAAIARKALLLSATLPAMTPQAAELALAHRRDIGAAIGRPLSSALVASERPSKCSARNLPLMKPFEAAMRRRGARLVADCAGGRLPDDLPDGICALSFDALAYGFEALALVRAQTQLPILVRGAILTEAAVLAAAEAGADAVAVPLQLLSDSGAEHVIRAAAELGLEVVAEGMDEEQLLAALRLGVAMASIASIDPMTLEADPGRAAALADFVPRRCVLLCRGAAETAAMMARTARRAGRALVFIAGEAVFGGEASCAQAA